MLAPLLLHPAAAGARPTDATAMLLAGLLAHPDPHVVEAAAGATRQLLHVMPQVHACLCVHS